jgi:cell division protease FtsH
VTPIEPPEKKPFPYWVLVIPLGGFALLFGLFLAIWQFLTPAERVVPVPYTDFLAEVHAGKVEEIHIHDREIRYRLRAADGTRPPVRETIGPIPDQALVESLKPTDPSAPLPKIIFEK